MKQDFDRPPWCINSATITGNLNLVWEADLILHGLMLDQLHRESF